MLNKITKKRLLNVFMFCIIILCIGTLGGCKHIPIIGEVFPFSWIDL